MRRLSRPIQLPEAPWQPLAGIDVIDFSARLPGTCESARASAGSARGTRPGDRHPGREGQEPAALRYVLLPETGQLIEWCLAHGHAHRCESGCPGCSQAAAAVPRTAEIRLRHRRFLGLRNDTCRKRWCVRAERGGRQNRASTARRYPTTSVSSSTSTGSGNLAGKLPLREDPGNYEQVRRLPGTNQLTPRGRSRPGSRRRLRPAGSMSRLWLDERGCGRGRGVGERVAGLGAEGGARGAAGGGPEPPGIRLHPNLPGRLPGQDARTGATRRSRPRRPR